MIGQTLGHYRIVEEIGRGGMGEVYAADDTRLGRRVALKALPPEFEQHPERRARLDQEARAVAALNHPNIVTLHSIEEVDGRHFITMELVKGRPLTELIPNAGLPVGRLLTLAAPIAEAIAAAHRAGITHRDLKPANVMVTDDGHVKVLDFGLAKPTTEAGATAATILSTARGEVVGTVAYMSPEQALGQDVDHRSDIFSFGILLYEMAAGQRPFQGKSVPGTMAAIIETAPPPLVERRTDLPRDLIRIIRRCLTKDRDGRYQSAQDLRLDLEDLGRELQDTAAASPAEGRGRPARGASFRWAAAGFGAAAALAAVLMYGLGLGGTDDTAGALDGRFERITAESGEEYSASLSPDGSFLVYAGRQSGNWDVYLKRVGGEKPINLTEESAADDTQPMLSPDGKSIVFRSERGGGGLFVMGATGESVRRVAAVGYNASWSPDQREILYSLDAFNDPLARDVIPSELWAVDSATGEKRRVSGGDAVQGAWSPRGIRIAYWGVHQGGQRDIWTVPAAGGGPVQVTSHAAVDWNPVWAPDGRALYFASDRGGSMNLWRVAIDEDTGRTLGEPQPVTTPSGYSLHPSFSRDGRSLAYVELISRVNVQRVGFDPLRGRATDTPVWMTEGARPVKNAELSPDGAWLVFDSISNQQEDLFVIRADGRGLRQLTDDAYRDRAPRWSPNGATIAFLSDRSGRYECWITEPDGSGMRQISRTAGAGWAQAPVWSPDGRRLACNIQGRAPIVLEVQGGEPTATPRVAAPGGNAEQPFFAWSWSPDGRRLAGWVDNVIHVYDFDTDRLAPVAADARGSRPLWLQDSRRLLFIQGDTLKMVDSSTGAVTVVLSVAPHRLQALDVSRDNRTAVLSVATSESDVWLASLR